MKNVKVVILAGGRGTRIPQYEKGIAKCLIEVAGRPILAHQIEQLKEQGFNNIRLSLGVKAGQVINWLDKNGYNSIDYFIEDEPLGTGGGIKNAIYGWKDPFIVLFGDIIADFNFKDIIIASRNGKFNVLAGFYADDVTGMGVLDYDKTGRVLSYKEKLAKGVSGIINANASFLHPQDFLNMPDVFSAEYDFFPEIISKGKTVLYRHYGYWFDCGTEERLNKARSFFANSRK